MKNSLNKGFTLIELLVVIAVIGVLSAVVLAALTTARVKGNDAAVRSQLTSMKSQAEIYYSSNGSNYGPYLAKTNCSTSTATNIFGLPTTTAGSLKNLLTGVLNKVLSTDTSCAVGAIGETNGTSWAIAVESLSDNTKAFCMDSTGSFKVASSSVASTTIIQTSTSTWCI